MTAKGELRVRTLGERTVTSPLKLSSHRGDELVSYVRDDARVLREVETNGDESNASDRFEKAGPREKIYFDPSKTVAGVVTCGGLCPGINNVIRSISYQLQYKYGVPRVLGFRYGYEGLNPEQGLEPVELTPSYVRHIHRLGGTVLGTSRGAQDPAVMVDYLEELGVNLLFAIGGDGTLKGAHAIAEEVGRRGRKIGVVGIPKTIDNDVAFVDKTFGFETAVEQARAALDAAHNEALSARNGIGLVKLMGRDSGFIAAQATLASMDVNFCLVPEVQFQLEGEYGLLTALENRLERRSHALIAVAEGCGATLAKGAAKDASGNVRYATGSGADIGPMLYGAIKEYFSTRGKNVTVKYIDPSYIIRSVAANADDSVFCDILARHAVHAGMAGKTDMVVGRRHQVFINVPLPVATSRSRKIDPEGELWLSVLEATGQPNFHRPFM